MIDETNKYTKHNHVDVHGVFITTNFFYVLRTCLHGKSGTFMEHGINVENVSEISNLMDGRYDGMYV